MHYNVWRFVTLISTLIGIAGLAIVISCSKVGTNNPLAPISAKYTLTIAVDTSRGTVLIDPLQLQVDSGTIIKLSATPKNGYRFVSWMENGIQLGVQDTLSILMNNNHTIETNFNKLLKLSAISNDTMQGTIFPSSATVDSGSTVTFLITQKTGYQFDSAIVRNEKIPDSKITGDTLHYTATVSLDTIKAWFTPGNFPITYSLYGGVNSSSNPSNYTIRTAIIILDDPTRSGYTFGGWYSDSTFATAVTQIAAGSTGNKMLYAKWTPVSYSIIYNLNSGTNSDSNPSAYTIAAPAITFATPSRTEYTFDGWYSDSTFATAITQIAAGSTGNKMLYAKWTVVQYTISYILNSGSNNSSNPATYTAQAAAITLADPTRTGYSFAGWYSDSTFATAVTQIAAGSTGNKMLYAKWTPVSYSIIYNLNGGTNSDSNPSAYTIAAPTITLATPSRTEYTFDGWYSDSTFATATTQIAAGSTGNIALFAKWTVVQYTISYILNSGSNNSSNPATYTAQTAAITLSDPTRTGYTFDGWYSDSTFATAVTQIAAGSTGNKMLYAKWTAVSYSIIYNLNGGTNSDSNPSTYTIAASTITLATPSRTGYTCDGWYSDSTFTTAITQIAAGSTGNIALFAKWTAVQYTISYILNSGSNNSSNPATYTAQTAAITLADPTRTGYSFAGWYSDSTFATAVTQIVAGSTGNKMLYAKWTAVSYSIIYNLNGGTNSGSNPSAYTIAAPTVTLAAPSRTEYTFDGWYSDSTFATAITQIAAGSTGNIALFAKWTVVQYTISYILNSGSNNSSNPATYTAQTAAITLADPTRTGYTFDGWYSDSTFATAVTQIAAGSTGNKMLYAKWTAVSYSIIYNLNGGTNSGSNPSTYTIAASTITLFTPTRTGYTFSGWYSDSTLTTAVTQIAAGSTGNKMLYAKWTTVSYSIIYNLNSGTNSGSNPSTYTIAASTITLATPTRTGYTFNGWFSDANFTTMVTEIPLGSTGTKYVYAKWTLLPLYGMVLIPAGTFTMGNQGTTTGNANEAPTHSVTISAFQMDSTEVTQGEYKRLMGGVNPSGSYNDLYPVNGVSWFDGVLYSNARSKDEGKDTVYSYTGKTMKSNGRTCDNLDGITIDYSRKGYRLPTEAEWEFACKAGTTDNYYWGASLDTTKVWNSSNMNGSPHLVAQKGKNPWGLYDMLGNVSEWVNDWYDTYASGSVTNPTGPNSGTERIFRGGGWCDTDVRSSVRQKLAPPGTRSTSYGFRVVLPQ